MTDQQIQLTKAVDRANAVLTEISQIKTALDTARAQHPELNAAVLLTKKELAKHESAAALGSAAVGDVAGARKNLAKARESADAVGARVEGLAELLREKEKDLATVRTDLEIAYGAVTVNLLHEQEQRILAAASAFKDVLVESYAVATGLGSTEFISWLLRIRVEGRGGPLTNLVQFANPNQNPFEESVALQDQYARLAGPRQTLMRLSSEIETIRDSKPALATA